MPHEPCTSLAFDATAAPASSRTGRRCAVPSRAIQISGSWPGLFGLRRYCQSQRRRLASAASLPNTRRYSASTARLSSGLYRVMSATLRPAPAQHVFHVADERVLRERAVRTHRASGAGKPPDGRGHVQFLADDPQSGVRDLAAQPRDADLLEQVVVLDLSAPRRLDERVLVRRLLQRPRRVAREARGTWRTPRGGRRSDAAEPASSIAAGARRRTTDTAPSTDTRARRARARARTRAGRAARRRRARSRRATARGRTMPSRKGRAMPSASAKCRLPQSAARGRAARPHPGTVRPDRSRRPRAASSASDSGMPPPPQPASSTRPRTATPARSRNAITFALR